MGRVAKTIFLLAYLDDEAYRRRILTQLNRGEARHALARKVFHGHGGELRQPYREGQEDQLGALGLVLNAIAVWNTRYGRVRQPPLERAMDRWWRWRDRDAAEMHWFAAELGKAGPTPPTVEEVLRAITARPAAMAQMIDVFNHRRAPSKVLTRRRVVAAAARLLLTGRHRPGAIAREVWRLAGEDRRHRRLDRRHRYEPAEADGGSDSEAQLLRQPSLD